MAEEITDDDIVEAAKGPAEAQNAAGRVKARELGDLVRARAVVARKRGWSPWGGAQNRLVPPGSVGPNVEDE